MIDFIKRFYIRSTGYSYTNLGRLFLRLFVGVMLLQFGVRQISDFPRFANIFPGAFGMEPTAALVLMIVVEIGCSLFIMCGFLTRLMTIPPIVALSVATIHLLRVAGSHEALYLLDWVQPVYLPVMFLGIYFFLLIVGPGKISVDYFLSLHLIHSDNKSEDELEEV